MLTCNLQCTCTQHNSVDPDIAIRRKAAFLLNTLLIPNEQDTSSSSPSSQSATIHSNSHASHLKDPSIAATSPLTVEAMKKHAITDAVIESLVNPVPYGDDGDQDEVDEDFEGRCIRYVLLSRTCSFPQLKFCQSTPHFHDRLQSATRSGTTSQTCRILRLERSGAHRVGGALWTVS